MTERVGCTVLLLLWLAGCGDNSMQLSLPDGNVLNRGASLRIVAEIREQGNPPEDGAEVTFATTVGSFEQFQVGMLAPVAQVTAEVSGGKAESTLLPFPGSAGDGEVTVSYTTINGIVLTARAPIVATGSSKASGAMLSAACDPRNVSALADPVERAAMRIRCVVSVKTLQGDPVVGAVVGAVAEGGCALTAIEDDDTADRVFVLAPTCDPADVIPQDGEPFYMDQGRNRNPRDGLLSLVFYTDGEEGFVDSNGNGQFDDSESFAGFDQAEPFIDANDNGQWDVSEQFLDLDGNLVWSQGNGRWDGATTIWVGTHLLLTGKPHESADATRFEPSGINIQNAGEQTLTLYLMDANLNPVATHDSGDGISLSVDGADLVTGDTLSLVNTMGIEFTQTGVIIAQSFRENRSFQITLQDSDPDPDSEPGNVTLDASVTWTPAPDFEDYSATDMSLQLGQVTGTSQ